MGIPIDFPAMSESNLSQNTLGVLAQNYARMFLEVFVTAEGTWKTSLPKVSKHCAVIIIL